MPATLPLPPRHGDTLVVAGLWVRPMVESARRAGWRVIALDLFGDQDTQRAARGWRPIGDASRMRIDGACLRAELDRAARSEGVFGWVAGSGFEGDPGLLDSAPGLPRFGTPASGVAALRDPMGFFARLGVLGLAHPAVQPADGAPIARGWLLKQAGGSGGWHIRDAGRAGTDDGAYLQRREFGEPMSALFLSNGRQARLVALSWQDVRPLGDRPFVYHGAVGPVHDAGLSAQVDSALARLVPAFGLRGLASADFLATPRGPLWLEVNPRPSASMLLYDDLLPRGLMHAHVAACAGDLPDKPRQAFDVRGHLVVYADRDLSVDATLAADLARRPHCHDLPPPGARMGAGEPLCSVSARAADMLSVRALLEQARAQVLERAATGAGTREARAAGLAAAA